MPVAEGVAEQLTAVMVLLLQQLQLQKLLLLLTRMLHLLQKEQQVLQLVPLHRPADGAQQKAEHC
jgi:hypothetical protein